MLIGTIQCPRVIFFYPNPPLSVSLTQKQLNAAPPLRAPSCLRVGHQSNSCPPQWSLGRAMRNTSSVCSSSPSLSCALGLLLQASRQCCPCLSPAETSRPVCGGLQRLVSGPFDLSRIPQLAVHNGSRSPRAHLVRTVLAKDMSRRFAKLNEPGSSTAKDTQNTLYMLETGRSQPLFFRSLARKKVAKPGIGR